MNTKQGITLAGLIVIAGAVGFTVGRTGFFQPPAAEPNAAAEDQTVQDERTILYWQAPMNPAEIYDQPGKSAMGMDLIPVYAEAESVSDNAGNLVVIDPTTTQNMAVRTEVVSRIDFSRMIRTVGEVKYDDEMIYEVSARISGWIETLHVSFVGEEVQQGDPLLEIYSPDLVTTQQELVLAVRHLESARKTGNQEAIRDAEQLVRSSRTRLKNWEIPDELIDQVEKTGEVQRTVTLRSPATGVVDQKGAVEGAHVSEGMLLFRIADLRTVWVHASFYENEVPWIVEGQPAEMELSYVPGKKYSGTVSYVYPYLREKARDVHVRLIFSNADLELKPGMYANVRLQGKVLPASLVIPTEAAIHSGERTVVFVAHGEGRFEPREIEIGEEGGPSNRFVRVLSGLEEGESIVVSGQFMLDSESRLEEAIQKMLWSRTDGATVEHSMTDMPVPTDTASQATEHIHVH